MKDNILNQNLPSLNKQNKISENIKMNKDVLEEKNDNLLKIESQNEYNNLNNKLKENNESKSNIGNHKNSLDLNEHNLHTFLNYDLINSLNNEDNETKTSSDNSELNSKGNFFSNQMNDFNQLDKNNNNSNSSKNDITIQQNGNSFNDFLGLNFKNNIDLINKEMFGSQILDLKERIDYLIDNEFVPIFIPKKHRIQFDNQNEDNLNKTKVCKKFFIKNKFDDGSENFNINTINFKEEKAKMPFQIRVGDWICLRCNNLNFSFRIKCNRCGLLKEQNHLCENNYYNHFDSNNKYIEK